MYERGSILHFEEWYIKDGMGMPKYGIVLNTHSFSEMLIVITTSQPYIDPDQEESCFYKLHDQLDETHYFTFWKDEEISAGGMTHFPKDTHLHFSSRSVCSIDVTGCFNNTIDKGKCEEKGTLNEETLKHLLHCASKSRKLAKAYKQIISDELSSFNTK